MKRGIYVSSLGEDIAVCVASVCFTAAFSCDEALSDELMLPVRLLSLGAMVLCWSGMSFFNGLRLRKGFASAVCVWFALPLLIQWLYGNVRVFRFSEAGLLLNEAARIILCYPYRGTGELVTENNSIVHCVMLIMCLLLFASGYVYTKINGLDKNENNERK